MSDPSPPIALRDLAEAETMLLWTWTPTGFRARLLRARRGPLFVVLGIAAVVFVGTYIIDPRGVVALGLLVGGALAAWIWVVRTSSLMQDGWASEHHTVPAERAVRIDVVVDGDELLLDRTRLSLTEIDHVLFVNGALRILHGSERVTIEVPRRAHRSVGRVLVPWLDHAIRQAKARQVVLRREEQAVRQAMATLRQRRPE